jgi:hypothetical protein
LVTKDHFSSSWTSWVWGGKSHEFVVGLAGVRTGAQGVAGDGVFIDAGQACGLADPTAVLEVLEDGEGLALREAGGEQGGALALGEAPLAGAADEQAALLAVAVAEADAEVPLAAQAVVLTVRVLAAEQVQLVHAAPQLGDNETVDNASLGL